MAFRGLSEVVAVIGGAGRGQQAQSAPAALAGEGENAVQRRLPDDREVDALGDVLRRTLELIEQGGARRCTTGTGPPPGAGAPSDPPQGPAARDRGHAPDRAPLPGGTRRSVGAGRRQHRLGALRQQPHPRRLAGLVRGWGDGSGPRAILACLPARGVARPGPNDLRRHPQPPRVADRLPRRGHAGRGTPLVPAACCRPFMTERSPAGGRLRLLAAPVLARPQEPRAALAQQLTHPAPPRSWTASRDFKRPV